MFKFNFIFIIKLMRPKQWTKNLFIFAAIIFSGKFNDFNIIKRKFIIYLFCLISSSIYILNDIVDVEKDKKHPQKKNRPIASGKVTVLEGYTLTTIFLIIVSYVSFNINIKLFSVFVCYFIINVFIFFKIKKYCNNRCNDNYFWICTKSRKWKYFN